MTMRASLIADPSHIDLQRGDPSGLQHLATTADQQLVKRRSRRVPLQQGDLLARISQTIAGPQQGQLNHEFLARQERLQSPERTLRQGHGSMNRRSRIRNASGEPYSGETPGSGPQISVKSRNISGSSCLSCPVTNG